MYKNWSALNLNVLLPITIDEAVDRLLIILTDTELQEIRNLPMDQLISMHFGLAVSLRNAFALLAPQSQLVAACPDVHPDDVAMLIITELWLRLQNVD